MLGHRTSLNKFQKTEIIQSIFPDHNGMKLEIKEKENRKIHKFVEINILNLNGSKNNSQGNQKIL